MRQTHQNTQINVTQETAEEQFAAIAATARNKALDAIDDLLTDDKSVDYSTPATPTLTQVQIHQQNLNCLIRQTLITAVADQIVPQTAL